MGGEIRPWVLGTLIYEDVKLERGEDGLDLVLYMHTPPTFTPFLFAPL